MVSTWTTKLLSQQQQIPLIPPTTIQHHRTTSSSRDPHPRPPWPWFRCVGQGVCSSTSPDAPSPLPLASTAPEYPEPESPESRIENLAVGLALVFRHARHLSTLCVFNWIASFERHLLNTNVFDKSAVFLTCKDCPPKEDRMTSVCAERASFAVEDVQGLAKLDTGLSKQFVGYVMVQHVIDSLTHQKAKTWVGPAEPAINCTIAGGTESTVGDRVWRRWTKVWLPNPRNHNEDMSVNVFPVKRLRCCCSRHDQRIWFLIDGRLDVATVSASEKRETSVRWQEMVRWRLDNFQLNVETETAGGQTTTSIRRVLLSRNHSKTSVALQHRSQVNINDPANNPVKIALHDTCAHLQHNVF